MKHLKIVLLCVLALISSATFAEEMSADEKQAQATAKMAAEADMQVGMPGITNFTEKKLARMLYELRDEESFATFTYIVNRNGKMIKFCQSIGYGLPYAVQFSNPERIAHQSYHESGSFATMPQPEPNGLFMPDAISATWVMCIHEGVPRAVYVEPKIVVVPFQLDE